MAAMTQGDWNSTIDRLAAATTEARQVITEAHGATRDLRQAIADARDLLARTVPQAVEAEVSSRVSDAVTEAIAALGRSTEAAMAAAVDKVGREFARLERLYLGLDDGKTSIEDATRRLRAQGVIPAAFRKDPGT